MTKTHLFGALAVATTLMIGCGGAPPTPPATPDPSTTGADADGDGVPDPMDKCPDKKEDGLGANPKDGCPDPAAAATPAAKPKP